MARRARLLRAIALTLAGFLLLPLELGSGGNAAPAARTSVTIPILEPLDVGDEIASFYRARSYRPLWIADGALRPEAHRLVDLLSGTAADTPELQAALTAAQGGDRHRLTRADLLLSRAYVAWANAHQRPPERSDMRYIDGGLAPGPQAPAALLEALASAPAMDRHLDAMDRINPVYDGLRRALAGFRGDAAQRQRILANIERARAIPARPGGRYILVDTASARLWMIENGRIVDTMRVVVGKRAMPTPALAGLIRYAALNPYWNLPPDLIRERARGGARAIRAEHLEVLSDWSPRARRLDPSQVDWRAVASGRRLVNLRQTPGAHNMMGRIKFMLPNDLGVYLHDTPLRGLFAGADRRQSAGCVRLEDAGRLERWLFRGRTPRPSGAPEQRVDLPEPVPVYIAYFTALPSRGGVTFIPDVYGRDRS
ncbi:MAG: L,D-transpeptidase family protein [Sphingomonas sp.]